MCSVECASCISTYVLTFDYSVTTYIFDVPRREGGWFAFGFAHLFGFSNQEQDSLQNCSMQGLHHFSLHTSRHARPAMRDSLRLRLRRTRRHPHTLPALRAHGTSTVHVPRRSCGPPLEKWQEYSTERHRKDRGSRATVHSSLPSTARCHNSPLQFSITARHCNCSPTTARQA